MASDSGSDSGGHNPDADHTQSAPPRVTAFTLDDITWVDPALQSAPAVVQYSTFDNSRPVPTQDVLTAPASAPAPIVAQETSAAPASAPIPTAAQETSPVPASAPAPIAAQETSPVPASAPVPTAAQETSPVPTSAPAPIAAQETSPVPASAPIPTAAQETSPVPASVSGKGIAPESITPRRFVPSSGAPASAELCNWMHGLFATDLFRQMILNGSYPLERMDDFICPINFATPPVTPTMQHAHSITFGQMPPTLHLRPVSEADLHNTRAYPISAVHQQVFAKFPRLATEDYVQQICAVVEGYYNSDMNKWGSVLPWEFPYGDRAAEDAFVIEQFGAHECEAWGGALNDGQGYRFLKNVWISLARYNAHAKINYVASWWWYKDDHMSLTETREGVLQFFRPNLHPAALFMEEDFDMWGETLLWHAMYMIVDQVYAFVQDSDQAMLQSVADNAQTQHATQAGSSPPAVTAAQNSSPNPSPTSVPVPTEGEAAQVKAPDTADTQPAPVPAFSPPIEEEVPKASAGINTNNHSSAMNSKEHHAPAHHVHATNSVDVALVHDRQNQMLPQSQDMMHASHVQPQASSMESGSYIQYPRADQHAQTQAQQVNRDGFNPYYEQAHRGDRRGRANGRYNHAGRNQYQGPHQRMSGSGYQQQQHSYQPPFERGHRGNAHSGGMQRYQHENVAPAMHMQPAMHAQVVGRGNFQQLPPNFAPGPNVIPPPMAPVPQAHPRLFDPNTPQHGQQHTSLPENTVTRDFIGTDCPSAKTLVVLDIPEGTGLGDMLAVFAPAGARIQGMNLANRNGQLSYYVDFATHMDARAALMAYHHGMLATNLRIEVAGSCYDPTHHNYRNENVGRSSTQNRPMPILRASDDVRLTQGHFPTSQHEQRPVYVPQSMMHQAQAPYDQRYAHQQMEASPYAMPPPPAETGSMRLFDHQAPDVHHQQSQRSTAQPAATNMPTASTKEQPKNKGAHSRGGKNKNGARHANKGAKPKDAQDTSGASKDPPSGADGAHKGKGVPQAAHRASDPNIRATTPSGHTEDPASQSRPQEPQPKKSKGRPNDTAVNPGVATRAQEQKEPPKAKDSATEPSGQDVATKEALPVATTSPVEGHTSNIKDKQRSLQLDTTTKPEAKPVSARVADTAAKAAESEIAATTDVIKPKVRAGAAPAQSAEPAKPAPTIDTEQSVKFSPELSSKTQTGKESPISEASVATAKQGSSHSSNGKVAAAERRFILGSSVAQTPTDAYQTAPNTPGREEHTADSRPATVSEDVSKAKNAPKPDTPKAAEPIDGPKPDKPSELAQPKETAATKAEKSKGPSQTESLSMFSNKKTKKPKKSKPVKGAAKKSQSQKAESSGPSTPSAAALGGSQGKDKQASEREQASDSQTASVSDESVATGAHGGTSSSPPGSPRTSIREDGPGGREEHHAGILLTHMESQAGSTESLLISDQSDEAPKGLHDSISVHSHDDTGFVSAGEPTNPNHVLDDDETIELEDVAQSASAAPPKMTKSQKQQKKKREKAKAKKEEARQRAGTARAQLESTIARLRADPQAFGMGAPRRPEEGEIYERPDLSEIIRLFSQAEEVRRELVNDNTATTAPTRASITDTDNSSAPASSSIFTEIQIALHAVAKRAPLDRGFLANLTDTGDPSGLLLDYTSGRTVLIDRTISPLAPQGRQWGPELNFRDKESAATAVSMFKASPEFLERYGGGKFDMKGLTVIFMPDSCEPELYLMPAALYGEVLGSGSEDVE
ncbi:hypothetical protein MBLNU230_g7496t1 [Neophaeotheca triangularis]